MATANDYAVLNHPSKALMYMLAIHMLRHTTPQCVYTLTCYLLGCDHDDLSCFLTRSFNFL